MDKFKLPSPFLVLLWFLTICTAVPVDEIPRVAEFGLEHNEVIISSRERYERELKKSENSSSYHATFSSFENSTHVSISIKKSDLRLSDDYSVFAIHCNITYTSELPLVLSYDLDSTHAAELVNNSWYRLPSSSDEANVSIYIYIRSKQIGISYIRFWIREANMLDDSPSVQSWILNETEASSELYYAHLVSPNNKSDLMHTLGFPMLVLRAKGVVQLIFRIVVVTMVSLFTFTMGCELDSELLRNYARRPIGPAIGFCCQFAIMPLVAFAVAYLIPIKQEFRFGLLTIGCSPGGGASNAWSLMLGGDINLSILMTFISSLSALFMMPLLLFALGRFFIDVNRVTIPYGNIVLQLVQITTPALFGLLLRYCKPHIARKFTKLTRPMFLFFILFFLTFGIYANWSIFALIGAYPIVMPTSALLPWIGFILAGSIAALLRQPRSVVITIALETGIQNVGAAILVLLYSMPQPAGDLGAVMPISVSIFTPFPLYFILLGLTIRRRCCGPREVPAVGEEQYPVEDADEDEAMQILKKKQLDPINGLEEEDVLASKNGLNHVHPAGDN